MHGLNVAREPEIQVGFDGGLEDDELVVDLFAGGGGASEGVEQALREELKLAGRHIDIAINHDPAAIAMHRANHPRTRHYTTSIWNVNPVTACAGRRVGFLWASPDCAHFSKAKGQAPRKKKIRSLAYVVTRWAKFVRPRVIVVENVEEFEKWGPLDANGKPIKELAGKTFKAWVAKLRKYGYDVQWRTLIAADYGAPTTRERIFVIARCDGLPIVWPEPTHGTGRAMAWRPASEIIDWSIPGRSIFGRARPLKPKTMARIAEGLRRYVFDTATPFVMPVHASAQPLRTVTTAKGGEFALVAALVTKHYGGVVGHGMKRPIGTVTSKDHHALTAAWLTKFYGTSVGSSVQLPLPTITSNKKGGGHLAEVRAFLIKYYGSSGKVKSQQQSLFDSPLHTVTSKGRFGLVVVHGELYRVVDITMRMLQPHELFGANGFPASYEIRPMHGSKRLTKTAQIDLCGNSVPPQWSRAIASANLRPTQMRAVA
jgi:DNA (cytosine-5)-methyltransferase 1